MRANELQDALFRTLRERRDTKPSILVKELCGIIFKSRPTIYKKLQGNISLTVDEMIMICDHYRIEIGSHLTEKPSYSSMVLEAPGDQGEHHCCDILLEQIHQWNNTAHTSVIVDVSDPFAYTFNYPVLTAFMLHYNRNLGIDTPFSFSAAASDNNLMRVAHRISTEYRGVNKIEFWRPYVFDHILLQIIYYFENNLFAKERDALDLLETIRLAIRDLRTRSTSALDHSRNQYCFLNSGRATNTIAVNLGDTYCMYRGQWHHGWTLTQNSRFSKDAYVRLHSTFKEIKRSHVEDCRDRVFFENLGNRIIETRQTLRSKIRA